MSDMTKREAQDRVLEIAKYLAGRIDAKVGEIHRQMEAKRVDLDPAATARLDQDETFVRELFATLQVDIDDLEALRAFIVGYIVGQETNQVSFRETLMAFASFWVGEDDGWIGGVGE